MGRRSSGEIIEAYVEKEKVMSSEFKKKNYLLTYPQTQLCTMNSGMWSVSAPAVDGEHNLLQT